MLVQSSEEGGIAFWLMNPQVSLPMADGSMLDARGTLRAHYKLQGITKRRA